ncbi:MAG TPA: YihY/virulence factor BrkB family protein [Actinocrinis sp.]|uniref:YihY/virulence factor BrkB family protein n=1 Tax=Actinocrinis sp. TaxID=1920516 RepID=UPI002DDC9FE8|nr:YihY/virulence factor BrkB family protein [Actinocrinis sp.]HEV2343532.1 YihY/virulence factor BrkB family protein [Actinocrinis sp.]
MPGSGVKGRIKRRFGPLLERAGRTTVMRAYDRYRIHRGSRLAAAITYSAFLSLFPLLAISVAIAAAALGDSGAKRLRDHVSANVPGIADKLPLDGVVNNAATIGLISGLLLVWSGLSWVNAARGGLRTIWAVEDMPGSFVTRKLVDLVALVGLGVTAVVSLAASAATSALADVILRHLGLADTTGARVFLWTLGTVVALAASTVMFAYLLAGIPRLRIPRGVLLRTALVAAVLFEVTKGLVAAYLDRVAGKTLYGAFGVPIALLLWFDITFQALLFLSAWTAVRTGDVLGKNAAGRVPGDHLGSAA